MSSRAISGDRRVVLELELRDQQPPLRLRAPLAAAVRVQPSDQLASEVERICGAGTVYVMTSSFTAENTEATEFSVL